MRAVALVLAALAALGSVEIALDRRAIEEALVIANSTIESTHVRFNADYHFALNAPPIDFISIVTPFRRVVLSGASARRSGQRSFGQAEAVKALQPDPQRVEVYVELTFHPLNTFIGVPDYDVVIDPVSPAGNVLRPEAIDRIPRYGPRLDEKQFPFPYPTSLAPRVRPGSEPLSGGTLIARIPGGQLNPKGQYSIVVRDGQKELGRVRVDLARLR
jgi:hypothetical protein